MVVPKSNTLSLVYRGAGTHQYIDYVNHTANSDLFLMTAIFRTPYDPDDDDDDDEEEEEEEDDTDNDDDNDDDGETSDSPSLRDFFDGGFAAQAQAVAEGVFGEAGVRVQYMHSWAVGGSDNLGWMTSSNLVGIIFPLVLIG